MKKKDHPDFEVVWPNPQGLAAVDYGKETQQVHSKEQDR